MIGKVLFFVMFWCARLLFTHVVVLTNNESDEATVMGIAMTTNPIISTDDEEKNEVTLVISVR